MAFLANAIELDLEAVKMSEEIKYCYAAKCRDCGHIVGLTSDSPNYRKAAAKDVAGWISDGLIVERMTSEEGRAGWMGCTCLLPTQTLPLFAEGASA